jgi:hypothetical protein
MNEPNAGTAVGAAWITCGKLQVRNDADPNNPQDWVPDVDALPQLIFGGNMLASMMDTPLVAPYSVVVVAPIDQSIYGWTALHRGLVVEDAPGAHAGTARGTRKDARARRGQRTPRSAQLAVRDSAAGAWRQVMIATMDGARRIHRRNRPGLGVGQQVDRSVWRPTSVNHCSNHGASFGTAR